MGLYLYALTEANDDADRLVDDLTGIQGETLQLFVVHDMAVVAGIVEGRPALARERLLGQDRLVRELHRRSSALLPMRFGSVVADYDEATRALGVRASLLRDQLELVRGRDQMTIRVLRQGADKAGHVAKATETATIANEASRVGTQYLEARAARTISSEMQAFVNALKSMQRATRIETSRHRDIIATLYQLIDRGCSDAYTREALAVAATLPVSVRISGPSPAYAFAAP